MLDFFYKNDIYVSQDVQQATCWLGTLLQKKKKDVAQVHPQYFYKNNSITFF